LIDLSAKALALKQSDEDISASIKKPESCEGKTTSDHIADCKETFKGRKDIENKK